MQIEYANYPKFSDANGDMIDLTVKFAQIAYEIPFTACRFDTEAHGVELFNRAMSGEFGVIAPFMS